VTFGPYPKSRRREREDAPAREPNTKQKIIAMIGFHAAALLLLFPFQGESKTDYFQLKTQQQLAGEILSVDDDSVTLKISLYGGTAEVTRKLKDFTPESAFRIVSSQA